MHDPFTTQLLFASLGDSLNHLVLNTTASPKAPVFGATTAVLSTADAESFAQVQAALEAASFPVSAVNLDLLPSDFINLGHGILDAYLTMLHRASVFDDPRDAEEYYATSHSVYILTPPDGAASPLPRPSLRTSGSGKSERDIPGVVGGVELLNQTVVVAVERGGLGLSSSVSLQNFMVDAKTGQELHGLDCITKNVMCEGDNYDTQYLSASRACMFHSHAHNARITTQKPAKRTDSCATHLPAHPGGHLSPLVSLTLPLGPDDVWVILGTEHTKTGKCSYTNFGLYYSDTPGTSHTLPKSTNLTVSDHKLLGSAASFAPTLDPPVAPLLFAYAIARNCSSIARFGFNSKYCLEVDSDPAIPPDAGLAIAVRSYLDPVTATRPAISEMILPTVLFFTAAP